MWLPRIASVQGWIDADVPQWWHYAGAAGPVTAALIVVGWTEGSRGVRRLLGRYRPTHVGLAWTAGGIVSLVVLFAVGLVAHRLVEGAWPAYADVAKASNLPALGLPLTLLVQVLTFGIGEETGWRGYALARLQDRLPALQATFALAVPWLLWHVPTFWGNESFTEMGAAMLAGWAVGLLLGAVFLTWLFNSSRGSLLAIVVWHGLFNTFVASEAAPDVIAPVVTAGIMVIAVLAVTLAGSRHLAGFSRRGGSRVGWESPGAD